MRVLVDGAAHPMIGSVPGGVGAILAEIDAILEHRGRGIVEVVVNGEPWSAARIDAELDRLPIASVESLEVITGSMRELVNRSLAEVESVIDELPAACHSLAASLTGPDRAVALESYSEFVDVWRELFDRHNAALRALGAKASVLTIDGVPLDAWQVRAWKQVEIGEELARQGDTAGLADLLTYELLPYTESEATVLQELRRLTQADASS